MLCDSLDRRGVWGRIVQLFSPVQLFCVTPWTAACQASLSFTISQSLLKLMSIESVMPCNHLILCHPCSSCLHSFRASGSFPMSQLFTSGGQSTGASASVLPMNILGWFPLVLTGLISWLSKRFSRVFSKKKKKESFPRGRMDTCISIAESLYCSPETITTLLISYTQMKNEKF